MKKINLLFTTLFTLPSVALAQINIAQPETAKRFSSLGDIIESAFNIIIVISGIIFMIMLLVGGLQYLTSAGVEDSAVKARKLILNAVIGLVIVTTAWAAGNYVLRILGIGIS
ncbi:hypothetical protein KC644_03130 [Candidatus Berkelbacteria bacterium]|nr:hypothetical protein [Candidatus Berkelbacteria bacterium]